VATPTATAELHKLFRKGTGSDRTRAATVSVLAEVAHQKDGKLREGILLELQVIAATDESQYVRAAAEEMVAALKSGKKPETGKYQGKKRDEK
jgi:hypothetical protein